MAYTCPRDLDGFLPHLGKPDTKFRQQLGLDLLAFLAEPSNSMVCQDIGQMVDGLIPWMHSSNYRVSSNGIEVMTYLVDRLGTDFRPYMQTVLPAVIDRLGDAKDTVREKAQLFILKLLERNVLTPQTLLERLTPGFSHKNAKIREEVLRCLVNTLNEHGAQSVHLNKLIPHIVKLLSDPTSTVRDTAFGTLVDLYKHVGEKLKADIQKRNLVPSTRLPALLARFEEVKNSGELLPSASIAVDYTDEVDKVVLAKPAIPVKKAGLGSAMKRSTSSAINPGLSSLSRAGSLRKLPLQSGAVDEETFLKAFEDVPKVQLFSNKDILENMKQIHETIADSSKDWNKRTEALKKIRSLIIAGAASSEDFHASLKQMELPLQETIKDLRSQVVRESCITIAYLSQTIGNKFDRAAEGFLYPLINLIQNSAKVVATAGLVCVRYILNHTQSPRLIPAILTNLKSSKSKEIRRSCCEFLEQILTYWQTHILERQVTAIQDALKKGISDADSDARVCSRRAFRAFKEHFPEQAEVLLQSLDLTYRRALQGELCLSSSSSSGSLAQPGALRPQKTYKVPTTPQSTTGSTENLTGGLHRAPSLPRTYRQRSGIPVLNKDNSGKKGFRSNSAIDLQAAQRAKARAQYAAMGRHKITSGTASLPRPRKSIDTTPTQMSMERVGRTRSRNSGVSQSQPTSRSGSPSSRLAYMYNREVENSPRPRRLSSGIPRSTAGSRDTSRETSPTRGSSLSRFRGRSNDRPPLSPASRPVMAQKMLQQSLEAECALASALQDTGDYHRMSSPRKSLRSMDNHSDDSETSSVCSERSIDSFRRPSDSYSWSGSQQRLSSSNAWEPSRDITEIIALCASTVWQERKEGLVSLRCYLNAGSSLTTGELLHITEIFTRMFMDSHTKGLSVFLDTLNELIKRHKSELNDWLYVLLQRVFNKLGTDLLSSTHSKLLNTLEVIKKNFPLKLQFCCVYRFLGDATQTPNTKVKIAVLNYLASLCKLPDAGQEVTVSPAKQALSKIIAYTQDMKGVEIRNTAKMCLVALWNCDTSRVTLLLTELPKEQQDIAQSIVTSHMRRSTSDSEPGSPLDHAFKSTSTSNSMHVDQEEIFRSIQQTTTEIQNYSYEGSRLDRDRDTTSQDSGISQMSLGNDTKSDTTLIEERLEELTVSANFGARTGPRSMPYAVNGVGEVDVNGYSEVLKDEELITKISEVCVVDNPTPIAEKKKLLLQLKNKILKGHVEHVIQNFKIILRILIDNLVEKEPQLQVVVLQILTAVFKNEEMKESWIHFVELLTIRVLTSYGDSVRDVAKAAEETAAAMTDFPFNTVVNVLCPFIQTSQYPTIQGAIKMLTKFIEMHPTEVTDEHLANILTGVIKANDHEESSVRKSAVFCMVALHKAVGEERLAPHISALSGSKMKLLRLYIGRASQQSVPTSPKNSAS